MSNDQRVVRARLRKPAEVAVCSPELAYTVADAQRSNASIVHLRTGDLPCSHEVSKQVEVAIRLGEWPYGWPRVRPRLNNVSPLWSV